MVFNKINFIKLFILSVVTIILLTVAFSYKGYVETNLLKTIVPDSISNNGRFFELSEKLSSVIKVVYESEDEDKLEELKTRFLENIDTNQCETINPDFSKLMQLYSKYPQNFLSRNDRYLIKNDKYEEIKQNALTELYNPVGIPLADFDKDPYFFLSDFVKGLNINLDNNTLNSQKISYSYQIVKLKDPSYTKDLVKIQKKLSTKNSKMYLAGSQIHSYHTQKNASLSINIICLLATLLILGLTYFYFKDYRIILPPALSIGFGFLSGYVVTKLTFNTFHIITLVFATTLIGIGIDYSYHYLFHKKHDKKFTKNLTNSMFTTVTAFILLYFTGFELLKQISVFTSVGLISIYLFVLIIFPCFNFPQSKETINIKIEKKFHKIIWIIMAVIILSGSLRLQFNDSLSAFYSPTKELKKAERLSQYFSGTDTGNTVILVKGSTIEELAENEESIGDILEKNNIDYISGSKFIPSVKQQKENVKLLSEFYKKHYDSFDGLLTSNPNVKYVSIKTNFYDIPYLKNFLMDNNTSVMYVYSDKLPVITNKNVEILDISKECEKYLHNYRKIVTKILPFIWGIILLFMVVFYGLKKGVKMFIPPLVSSIFALSVCSLIGQSVTLFSLISVILILGFTIDYSIFRAEGERKSEDGILISCITTAFSFFALSFTTFKFISSLSFILFIGIVTSYILGKVLFSDDKAHI